MKAERVRQREPITEQDVRDAVREFTEAGGVIRREGPNAAQRPFHRLPCEARNDLTLGECGGRREHWRPGK